MLAQAWMMARVRMTARSASNRAPSRRSEGETAPSRWNASLAQSRRALRQAVVKHQGQELFQPVQADGPNWDVHVVVRAFDNQPGRRISEAAMVCSPCPRLAGRDHGLTSPDPLTPALRGKALRFDAQTAPERVENAMSGNIPAPIGDLKNPAPATDGRSTGKLSHTRLIRELR